MAENKTTKKVVRAKKTEIQAVESPNTEEKKTKVVTIKAKGAIKKENATHNAKDAAPKAPVWAYWTFIPLAFVMILGLVIFMIVASGSVK